MRFLVCFVFVLHVGSLSAVERRTLCLCCRTTKVWSGLSVAMHPDVPGSKSDDFHTPNIELLAAQGMRFSAAYSPASVCSPTRISLQTVKVPPHSIGPKLRQQKNGAQTDRAPQCKEYCRQRNYYCRIAKTSRIRYCTLWQVGTSAAEDRRSMVMMSRMVTRQ